MTHLESLPTHRASTTTCCDVAERVALALDGRRPRLPSASRAVTNSIKPPSCSTSRRSRPASEGDFGRLVLGASGYVGMYVDQQKIINPVGDNLADLIDTVNYSEQILGFDVALDVSDLRIRSEGVLRWVEYQGDKTETIFTLDGSTQYLPNRLEWAGTHF